MYMLSDGAWLCFEHRFTTHFTPPQSLPLSMLSLDSDRTASTMCHLTARFGVGETRTTTEISVHASMNDRQCWSCNRLDRRPWKGDDYGDYYKQSWGRRTLFFKIIVWTPKKIETIYALGPHAHRIANEALLVDASMQNNRFSRSVVLGSPHPAKHVSPPACMSCGYLPWPATLSVVPAVFP